MITMARTSPGRRHAAWVCAAALLLGCSAAPTPPNTGGGGQGGGTGGSAACPSPPQDTDGDGISDVDEGALEAPPRDTDGDGTPDYLDDDSDGDGIPDAVEGRNPTPCDHPVDSDGDGKPDFQDLDSDSATDSTVPDAEERGPTPGQPLDTNGDGRPDYLDPDNDGDGLYDEIELTPQGAKDPVTSLAAAPDTDGDGIPDFRDTDADGDGIPDAAEGAVDTDGDGSPNYRDLDADGDCVPDAAEGAVDSDGDQVPDFLDLDSDGDGLADGEEDKSCDGQLDVGGHETDRTKADTDGDGVSDLAEVIDCQVKPAAQQAACLGDATDPSHSPLTRGDFVFTSDYLKPPAPAQLTLALPTDVSQADVVFALDTTGSMEGSLTTLASTIASNIVPKAKAKVKNLAFGVVDFRDFGDDFVVRYDHRIQTVNTAAGVASVQGALNALSADGGGDLPEAGWEALYAIAGGPSVNVGGYSSHLDLAHTFPTTPTPGEVQGTLHGAGFRAGSVPIIIAVTDAEWHDAPGVAASGENGLNDYPANLSGVPSRQTALTVVNGIGAHVMALVDDGFGSSAKQRGLATAHDTGAMVAPAAFGSGSARPAGCAPTQCCTGASGAGEAPVSGKCPLAFTFDTYSGSGVNDAVVSGIVALANGLAFDIHVEAIDVDPNTVDNFIEKLVPNVSGTGAAAMCLTVPLSQLQDNFTGPRAATAAADGVRDTFVGVGGGVKICFDVVPKQNTTVPATASTQYFHAQLVVKGASKGSTVNLGAPRDVFFIVPPLIPNGTIPG